MAIRGSRVFIFFILLLYLGYLGEKDVQINTFKKAAYKGNTYAERRLMYDYGEILDETDLNNLGWMFYEQQDYANALEYYKKAAHKGSGTAQYSIGMMFKNGKGVNVKSWWLAYFWFYLAHLNGKEEAKKEIDYIEGVGLFSKRQLSIDETERIKQRAQEMYSKQKKR